MIHCMVANVIQLKKKINSTQVLLSLEAFPDPMLIYIFWHREPLVYMNVLTVTVKLVCNDLSPI